jgi:hypothetical protein
MPNIIVFLATLNNQCRQKAHASSSLTALCQIPILWGKTDRLEDLHQRAACAALPHCRESLPPNIHHAYYSNIGLVVGMANYARNHSLQQGSTANS